MKAGIVISVIPFLFLACDQLKTPVLSQNVQAKSLSYHRIMNITSYEIPEGIFRGVLWPSESRKSFQLWVIDGKKELFFDIPTPLEFGDYREEVTEGWKFRVSNTSNNKIIYLATKKNNHKSIQIELPLKKRPYRFSVLKNPSSEEILIFMDISEHVVDKGVFGYVIIQDNDVIRN